MIRHFNVQYTIRKQLLSMSAPPEPTCILRNTRQRKIVLDLNVPPPTENRELVWISPPHGSHGGPSAEQSRIVPPPIDLEAIDDDVTISSARAFEQVWFFSVVNWNLNLIFILNICFYLTIDYILLFCVRQKTTPGGLVEGLLCLMSIQVIQNYISIFQVFCIQPATRATMLTDLLDLLSITILLLLMQHLMISHSIVAKLWISVCLPSPKTFARGPWTY